MTARSKSSARWLQAHGNDPYVQRAKVDGWRSRASYKLLELQQKDRLFRPGMTVVDLGAAPGGWSQVAARLVSKKGRIIASDILPMEAITGVDFVLGDFTESAVLTQLLATIGPGRTVDLVISDMAPNISGIAAIDQPSALYLAELALDLARQLLNADGTFLTKVFQGEGFDAYLRAIRSLFKQVRIRKPQASKPRSREVYLLASQLKD